MCGIAGAIGALGPTDMQSCETMSDRLRHRGPDDSGSWSWQVGESFGAILCFRRLAIIDLRSVASQPMTSRATGTTLVFNGEIYNFRELRAELEAAGARFFTNGDSEVILNGYDHWGVDVFAKLRGMFALVIVDPAEGRTVMARDGYGIKPLYWAQIRSANGKPSIAFASETRALVEAGYARPATDQRRVGQFLWNGFMPGPETIWSDIHEVPRGTFAVLDGDHRLPEFRRYWTVGNSLASQEGLTLEEADELIANSARLHLTADVPKVVFLSGGVDSTAVAAAAAAAGGELHTLTLAFAEVDADERRFANAAANAIGSTHHVVELSAESVLRDVGSAVDALDQPSFDGVNTWFVSREAAHLGFKVALSGAGGDELAGGYTSFRRALSAASLMSVPGSRLAGRVAGQALQQFRPSSKLGQLGQGFGAYERMYQTQYALFSTGTLKGLLADARAVTPWGLDGQRESSLATQIASLSTLRAVTALESEMFLGDRLLRDMDGVSMAHSIELRVPLVDTFLSDALAGLSDEDRYFPIGEKRLLRRQSQAVLPDSFFSRPKRGFEFPMDSWMRGPLRPLIESELLDEDKCTALGLQAKEVASIWKRFRDQPGALYWTRPWALFSLLHWASVNGVSCDRH